MRKYSLLIFLALLFAIVPVVSAADTVLKIKTMPYHEVIVTVSENDVYNVLTKVTGEADEYGDLSLPFSVDNSEVRLYVLVRWNKEKVLLETLDDIETGSVLDVKAYPDGYTPKEKVYIEVVNESDSDTVNNESAENNNSGFGEAAVFNSTEKDAADINAANAEAAEGGFENLEN